MYDCIYLQFNTKKNKYNYLQLLRLTRIWLMEFVINRDFSELSIEVVIPNT